MGLGRFIGGLARTAVDVALLPIDVAVDVATSGISTVFRKKQEPFTWSRLKAIRKDLDSLPEKIEE